MDWEPEVPGRLFDLCFEYCIKNQSVFCEPNKLLNGKYQLKDGIFLPSLLCEQLVSAFRDNRNLDLLIPLFIDTSKSKLTSLKVRDGLKTTPDGTFCALFKHNLTHLDMVGCVSVQTPKTLTALNQNCQNLTSLCVSGHEMFNNLPISDSENIGDPSSQQCGVTYIFNCPKLKALALHELHDTECCAKSIITVALKPLTLLSHLDLSCCEIEFETMQCIGEMKLLRVLVLYNVPIKNINLAFSIIAKLTSLRALDLSQGQESAVVYQESDASLGYLMQHLTMLTDLDLSGTNLAGFVKKETVSHRPKQEANSSDLNEEKPPILGLEGRHLKFLGLLGCSYEASARKNIPADRVTGDATEQQVVFAVQTYLEKTDLLVHGLNLLFHRFRYSECTDQRGALEGILNAMKRWPHEKHVQICGSASLFYIVKGEKRYSFNTKLKQRIIKAVIEGMDNHMDESTMMRNGSLTLCHFSIPKDVRFVYKELVTILLKMVAAPASEEFVQRIGIYLLNSLACQVDGNEKKLVGDLGAINTMLEIIRYKLSHMVCDEVMEIAWSTMWNVTDETSINCERFIDEGGMDLFLSCLEKFPDREELLRNMMGLLGNVAEVPDLRCRLMVSKYVSVFSELLDSTSDGIEVSYNACGVLSHMVSDGPGAWTINHPSRTEVLLSMEEAISRWKLKTKRNINYRSFEPILRLVLKFNTPQCQQWAVWALCNLTKMYRGKYCPLLEKENGLDLLQQVVAYSYDRPCHQLKELAQSVIDRCRRFKETELEDFSDEEAEPGMDVEEAVLEG